MAEQFDPYRKWLGIPSQDQPPNHYQLLGIPALENDPDVIENAANRQMAHVRTFQNGKHSKVSQQILNELSAAKRCLLIPEKKTDYDTELKDQLAPTNTDAPAPQRTLPPSPTVQQAPPPPAAKPASNPVQVRSRRSSAARRHRRKQRKSSAIPMLMGIIVTAIVVGLVILAANRKNMKTPKDNKPSQGQTSQIVFPRKAIDTSMVPLA